MLCIKDYYLKVRLRWTGSDFHLKTKLRVDHRKVISSFFINAFNLIPNRFQADIRLSKSLFKFFLH
jgi:hypothetical protein